MKNLVKDEIFATIAVIVISVLICLKIEKDQIFSISSLLFFTTLVFGLIWLEGFYRPFFLIIIPVITSIVCSIAGLIFLVLSLPFKVGCSWGLTIFTPFLTAYTAMLYYGAWTTTKSTKVSDLIEIFIGATAGIINLLIICLLPKLIYSLQI